MYDTCDVGYGVVAALEMDGEREVPVDLTADEAEQYDRQIRLWGLEAQKRYSNVGQCCVIMPSGRTYSVSRCLYSNIFGRNTITTIRRELFAGWHLFYARDGDNFVKFSLSKWTDAIKTIIIYRVC